MIEFSQEYIDNLVRQATQKAERYIESKDYFNAEALYKQILRVSPENRTILKKLGATFCKNNKPKEAIEVYEQYFHDDSDPESMNDAALAYSLDGCHNKSISILKKCIKKYPDYTTGRFNLALEYKNSGKPSLAEKIYLELIDLAPGEKSFCEYATFLMEQGDFEKAIEYYEKSLKIQENWEAYYNLGWAQLKLGRYSEGFNNLEWRFQNGGLFQKCAERYPEPFWNGEDLTGKSILVFNEQGFGDAIQMVRYLPNLKKLGADVALETTWELEDLFKSADGWDEMIKPFQKNRKKYDYKVSINSLPRFFQEIPQKFPYVAAGTIDPYHFKEYHDFRVGICWAGNPVHREDHYRSCCLSLFQGIHDLPKIKLFSLQKDLRNRFWPGKGVVDLTEKCDTLRIVNMSDVMRDFNYTAAIVAHMDLIITVDTAIAHLAGALNRPCWVLVPKRSDWRWHNTVKWYPSLRIFRQKVLGNWEPVFQEVCHELRKLSSK